MVAGGREWLEIENQKHVMSPDRAKIVGDTGAKVFRFFNF